MNTKTKKRIYGDERDTLDAPKTMNKSFNYRSTMPPRQREGQEFIGGKAMRKAKRKLVLRQKAHVPNAPNAKQHKRHYPGSLSK